MADWSLILEVLIVIAFIALLYFGRAAWCVDNPIYSYDDKLGNCYTQKPLCGLGFGCVKNGTITAIG